MEYRATRLDKITWGVRVENRTLKQRPSNTMWAQRKTQHMLANDLSRTHGCQAPFQLPELPL